MKKIELIIFAYCCRNVSVKRKRLAEILLSARCFLC
nr:MAG TPA: hypothetical protein [Caudoviricetes sp.]